MAGKKKDLKSMVDQQLTDMMESESEPSEGRMKLLTIAIKKLALDAKLEESDYGGFFGDEEHAGSQTRKPNGSTRIPAKET